MAAFVDHLQLLPMPHQGGRRQPDGAHRPGGLGTRTVADGLEERGWVARIEDIAFDKPMSERRLAEAYARGLGDAVLSARDRNRFPLLLLRSGYGALGPIDALGERAGVAWVGPRGDYGKSGLLRRPSLDSCALSMVTGRVERDRFAIRPVRLAGGRIVVVGGHRIDGQERRALAEDGIRVVEPGHLGHAVAGIDADAWYLHVDLRALRGDAVPGSDEPDPGGVEPDALAGAIGAAFEGRPLRAVGFARYDLNRDEGGRTLATLIQLIEAAVVAAGGVPRPGARAPVR